VLLIGKLVAANLVNGIAFMIMVMGLAALLDTWLNTSTKIADGWPNFLFNSILGHQST
jgi:hypothetical protein